MPVCARPVRTLARSALKASTLLCILISVFFFRSAIMAVSVPVSVCSTRLHVHQGAFVLARDHAPKGARAEDAEHVHRQPLVPAQRQRGRIHDLEIPLDRLVETDPAVALRGG